MRFTMAGDSKTDPRRVFPPGQSQILACSTSPDYDDGVAQPGDVGASYATGGIVFIGEPGSRKTPRSAGDVQQLRVLEALKKADPAKREDYFGDLTRILTTIMPGWREIDTYAVPILVRTRLPLSQVAHINLLKWRSNRSDKLEPLYKTSWDLQHTRAT